MFINIPACSSVIVKMYQYIRILVYLEKGKEKFASQYLMFWISARQKRSIRFVNVAIVAILPPLFCLNKNSLYWYTDKYFFHNLGLLQCYVRCASEVLLLVYKTLSIIFVFYRLLKRSNHGLCSWIGKYNNLNYVLFLNLVFRWRFWRKINVEQCVLWNLSFLIWRHDNICYIIFQIS